MKKKYGFDKLINNWINKKTELSLKEYNLLKGETKFIETNEDIENFCLACSHVRKDKKLKQWSFVKKCEICRWDLFFASKYDNSLCYSCSKKHGLCVYCGSKK